MRQSIFVAPVEMRITNLDPGPSQETSYVPVVEMCDFKQLKKYQMTHKKHLRPTMNHDCLPNSSRHHFFGLFLHKINDHGLAKMD